MAKNSKRALSLLICLCMVLSLFTIPITGSAANSNQKNLYGVDVSTPEGLTALASALPDGGQVVQYSDLGEVTTKNNGTFRLVKMDVGIYNAEALMALRYRFTYNSDQVTLVRYTEANANAATNGAELTSISSGAGLSTYKTDESFLLSSIDPEIKDLFMKTTWTTAVNDPENTGVDSAAMFQYTLGTTLEAGTGSEKIASVEIQTRDKTTMEGLKTAGYYDPNLFLDPANKIKFGQNKVVDMYAFYFKVNDGAVIDNNTFSLKADESFTTCPSGSSIAYVDGITTIHASKDAAFVNFPKAEAPKRTATLTIKDGSDALPNAKVSIYQNSVQIGETQTTTSGTGGNIITFADLEEGTYTYKVEADQYVPAQGTFTIEGGNYNQDIAMTKVSAKAYDIQFTAIDAYDGTTVTSAQMSKSTNLSYEATTDGVKTYQLTAGDQRVYAKADGYNETIKDIKVVANSDFTAATVSAYTIALEKERAKNVKIPVPNAAVDGSTTQPIVGSTITIDQTEKTNTEKDKLFPITYVVREGGKLYDQKSDKEYDIATGVELPKDTKYVLSYEAAGYSAANPGYMTIDAAGSAPTYYKTSGDQLADTNKVTEVTEVTPVLDPIDDPVYDVVIERGSDDKSNIFTAKVVLRNVKATFGTFGLKYDDSLFKLADTNGFVLNESVGIEEFNQTFESGKNDMAGIEIPAITTGKTSTGAYHAFIWQTKNIGADDAFLDAISGALVATYTFELKPGANIKNVTANSFTVMPYDLTENGAKAIAACDGVWSDAYPFLMEFFRYTDAANVNETSPDDPDAELPEGRIHKSKALANGFYQVAVTELASGEAGNGVYDVITNITYSGFNVASSKIEFIVKDEVGAPVPNAMIDLYDAADCENVDGVIKVKPGAAAAETLTADATGSVAQLVDTSKGQVTYYYAVNKHGYWAYPFEWGTLAGNDAVETEVKPVTSSETGTTTETVVLTTKIYHPVSIKKMESGEITGDAEHVTNAGAEIAYNGVDYLFNIKPDSGYAFTIPVSKTLPIVINGENKYATFNAAKNAFVIPADYIDDTTLAQLPPAADDNGFKSSDIVIKLDSTLVAPAEETYTITANAGPNGTVMKGASDADPASEKTQQIKSGDANKDSDDFIFTPAEGYRIDKVYLNGAPLSSDSYKIEADYSMSYKFVGVDKDQNITVTFGFYDPNDPEGPIVPSKTEAAVSVAVGDKGSAEVTAPAANTATIPGNTTKTFIVDTTKADDKAFTLTVTPESADYVVDSVEAKDTAGTTVELTKTDSSYSFEPAGGKQYTVLVKFKEKNAAESFTVFVNAYVESGVGTISPSGILSYNLGDSPEFTFTTKGSDWEYAGVKVNGELLTGLDGALTNTPQKIPALTGDTTVGATFGEKGYRVTGIVDLSSGAKGASTVLTEPVNTPATVTFTRKSDKKKITQNTTLDRTNATFTVSLPLGTWDVTVSKNGYLNYTITGFEVTTDMDGKVTNFGGTDAPKPIVPLAGDASWDHGYITLGDAGIVANGFLSTASENGKRKANVIDNSDRPSIEDMTFVKVNFGARATTVTYTKFSS